MIDGFKILNVPANATELSHNSLLNWKLIVSENEGEITGQFAEHCGLTFVLKNHNIKLYGSLHKYFNNGIHNHNDFNYQALTAVIDELSRKFDIDANRAFLNNVKFGVNVRVNFEVKSFLRRLIAHKGKGFNLSEDAGKYYLQCEHEQFYIKIYDKGLHYGLQENILRFEIKVIKMQFFQQKNICLTTLQNLIKPHILEELGKILYLYWNEILFDEPALNPDTLPDKAKTLLLNGRNPKFWIDLYESQNRTKKDYTLKKFRALLASHTDSIPTATGKLISEKWQELMQGSPKTEILQIYQPEKYTNYTLFTQKGSNLPYLPETVNSANLHFNYTVNLQNLKRCQVTGLQLIGQKRNSKFISEKTLKQFPDLLTNAGFCFDKHKRKHNLPESYYLAHNLRNAQSNPRNNLKRRLKKSIAQTLLFEPAEVIRLNEEQKRVLNC
jgi:hypothetical protein